MPPTSKKTPPRKTRAGALREAPRPVDFADLPDRIRAARSILLFSHVGPDADNVGSLVALKRGLSRLCPRVVAANADPVPRAIRFLPGIREIANLREQTGPFDLAIALDCSDAERPGIPDFRKFSPFLVNLDHHIGNTMFGDLNLVEPARTSTCELAYRLLRLLSEREGVDLIDRETAICLFTGIMGDTIRFLTASCTPEVYGFVADLVARGADPQEIGTLAYMNNTLAGSRVLAHVLSRVEPALGGALMHFTVTDDLRASYGATLEDTSPIVNHLLSVEGVETAVVIEYDGPVCNVSMRSKRSFDVGAIARELGGGGHMNAAGCQLPAGPGVAGRVLSLVEERMRSARDTSSRQGTAASAAS